MGRRIIFILAVLAIVLAIVQYTPLAFLSEDAADFVNGLAVGLTLGALVAWWAGRGQA